MVNLIRSKDNNFLSPNQIALIMIDKSILSENEFEYILEINFEHDDSFLSKSVLKELIPNLDKDNVKKLLCDSILREYQIEYNSSKRLTSEQSNTKIIENIL